MVLGGLKVATASFDIKSFPGKDWEYWKGPLDGNGLEGEPMGDNASAVLQEVDFAQSDFLTCLKKGETSIKGTEKYPRLKKSGRTLYGVNVFMGLLLDWQALDYQVRGAESILEKLWEEKGITYLDFFDDLLRRPDGRCCVLCLCRIVVGRWCWHDRCLDDYWNDYDLTSASKQAQPVQ